MGMFCSPVPKFRVLAIVIGLLAAGWVPAVGTIRINEFMTGNDRTLADEDGDYSDWIELMNVGATPVNLTGWGLSDDLYQPHRWVFPSRNLQPGEILVVWASSKNRSGPALHTNFSLSAEGEPVVLYDPGGRVVDFIDEVRLPRDVSFGRGLENPDKHYYFPEPTPGAPNDTAAYVGVLDAPSVNMMPGFYQKEVTLTFSHPDPEARIVYTMDGSPPGADAIPYAGPLRLTTREGDANTISMIRTNPPETSAHNFDWEPPSGLVAKAHALRVAAIKDGYFPGEGFAGTWFVGSEHQHRSAVDTVSLIVDPHDLFDHYDGIYVPGYLYERDGYGDDMWGRWGANYFGSGREWERSAHFEYFRSPSGGLVTAGPLGVRIHGGGSRALPQKTLRLYDRRGEARGEGLQFPFFDDLNATSFRTLILRNSGQDWISWSSTNPTMLLDGFLHTFFREMNLESQAYRPTVVFLNGEYWGIHNLRERTDEHYLSRHYGVDPDTVDLISGRWDVEAGSMDHYNSMLEYMRGHDLAKPEVFDEVKRRMDVDNYIDYMIAQTYGANHDWPWNNIRFWREQVDYDPEAPQGRDGRWRWILYDLDNAADKYVVDFDMFHRLKHPDELPLPRETSWSLELINHLWKNEAFVQEFCGRYAAHLNITFQPARGLELLEILAREIETEIEEHFHRWGRPFDWHDWQVGLADLEEFLSRRPENVLNHLDQNFALGGQTSFTLRNPTPQRGALALHGVVMDDAGRPGGEGRPKEQTVAWFRHLPARITAIPDAGHHFVGWEELPGVSDAEVVLTPGSGMSLTPKFERSPRPPSFVYPKDLIALVEYEPLHVSLTDFFRSPDGLPIHYTVMVDHPAVTPVAQVGNALYLMGVNRGETTLRIQADDGINSPVEATVQILVYPDPHPLASESFTFSFWSPEARERTFPVHMLFLQSNRADPPLHAPLNHVYKVGDDVHADDSHGFPYNNTRRTRINGLGDQGVSFINTGRARDLGGVLLALDTRGVDAAHVVFNAGTVEANARPHAWRLQYRIGSSGTFSDLHDAHGKPIEYRRRSGEAALRILGPYRLPQAALGHPNVQLIWRYYPLNKGLGARSELQLARIFVQAGEVRTFAEWQALNYPDPGQLENPEVSGPAADPNGLGLPNLVRYATGYEAGEPIEARLPRFEGTSTNLSLVFPFDAGKEEIRYVVEVSLDLGSTWETLFDSNQIGESPEIYDAGWVSIPVPEVLLGHPQVLARLVVSLRDAS